MGTFYIRCRVEHITDRKRGVSLMAQSQSRNDARLAELTEKMTELAEAQTHTDERLGALIAIVDRCITRGGNGSAGN